MHEHLCLTCGTHAVEVSRPCNYLIDSSKVGAKDPPSVKWSDLVLISYVSAVSSATSAPDLKILSFLSLTQHRGFPYLLRVLSVPASPTARVSYQCRCVVFDFTSQASLSRRHQQEQLSARAFGTGVQSPSVGACRQPSSALSAVLAVLPPLKASSSMKCSTRLVTKPHSAHPSCTCAGLAACPVSHTSTQSAQLVVSS